MKKILLTLAMAAFLIVPGYIPGFSRPAPRPVVVPRPMPVHTPAYVAPRPVAPIYHPPARPVYPVQPIVRPPVTPVHPIVRPPVTVQPIVRPPVTPVRPIVRPPLTVQPIVRPPVVNRPVMVNRGIYINRGNAYYRPGWSYYHGYYDNWHHGYWGSWYRRPWLWFGSGVAAGWLWATTPNVTFYNPYWVAPVGVPVVYDYALPIPVPQPVAIPDDSGAPQVPDPTMPYQAQSPPPAEALPDDPNAAAAAKLLDDGRQAFLNKDYDGALKLADQALRTFPKDATLHEFRALVLFAQQRYQDAAATIYAVLAVGPGWDWDTLSSFYRNTQDYTAQLRALEAYTRANPKDAGARFLLAYHYLTEDYRDAAAQMLRSVVSLQPNDQLAAYLLQMLENKGQNNRPVPGM